MLKNIFSLLRCCNSTNDIEENKGDAPRAQKEIMSTYKIDTDLEYYKII